MQVRQMLVQKTNQQVSTQLEGEVVLLELQTGKYFTLNEVGAFVWQLLDAPKSKDALVLALTEEYEVDTETAKHDIEALVSDLLRVGLVTLQGA